MPRSHEELLAQYKEISTKLAESSIEKFEALLEEAKHIHSSIPKEVQPNQRVTDRVREFNRFCGIVDTVNTNTVRHPSKNNVKQADKLAMLSKFIDQRGKNNFYHKDLIQFFSKAFSRKITREFYQPVLNQVIQDGYITEKKPEGRGRSARITFCSAY